MNHLKGFCSTRIGWTESWWCLVTTFQEKQQVHFKPGCIRLWILWPSYYHSWLFFMLADQVLVFYEHFWVSKKLFQGLEIRLGSFAAHGIIPDLAPTDCYLFRTLRRSPFQNVWQNKKMYRFTLVPNHYRSLKREFEHQYNNIFVTNCMYNFNFTQKSLFQFNPCNILSHRFPSFSFSFLRCLRQKKTTINSTISSFSPVVIF